MTRSRTATALAALVALTGALLVPATLTATSARADDPAPLVVVGPPELLDSGFWEQVVEPLMATSYSGVPHGVRYVALDADEAVAYAESGQASALLLSAPEAESRFVADGFSAAGHGRPVFWTDDVLLGPRADPAGVRASARHDVVTALERIAASGVEGKADFVSQGGASDRAAVEHALWAMTDGVPTCTLSAAAGGGEVPSTVGGACPDDVPYPAWFHETETDQPATVRAAGACEGYDSAACYALSDRGTFDRLVSTGADLGSLGVAVSGNDTAAGDGLLVSPFHAYVVDPEAAPAGAPVDVESAKRFLWQLTSAFSPSGAYLVDEPMPAFRPSATLRVTLAAARPEVLVGDVVERRGVVTSRVPGDPPLRGFDLLLNEVVCGFDHCDFPNFYPVASARTDANGAFRFRMRATESMGLTISGTSYADIDRVVDASTDPDLRETVDYLDEDAGYVRVRARLDTVRVRTGARGRFNVRARLAPTASGNDTKVQLYAARPGQRLAYRSVVRVPRGASSLNHTFTLARGTWKVELRYVIPYDDVEPASHATRVVLR